MSNEYRGLTEDAAGLPWITTALDARLLSSGTVAGLTGFTRYDQIDLVQHSFVAYCEDIGAKGRWQDHWQRFWCS